MNREDYFTTTEAADALGISRIAVYQKIQAGIIPAVKFGRNYLIEKARILEIAGKVLTPERREGIEAGVDKAVAEYGNVLRRLGKE